MGRLTLGYRSRSGQFYSCVTLLGIDDIQVVYIYIGALHVVSCSSLDANDGIILIGKRCGQVNESTLPACLCIGREVFGVHRSICRAVFVLNHNL